METFSQNHRNLQVLCAEIWSSAADCELILSYLGIESSHVNLAEPSIMRWLSIIRELMFMNDGSLSRLVIVLMNQYPNNTTLRAVCAPWMPVAPASVLTTHADPLPVAVAQSPVPVMVAAEFAEEAALILPRLDALWQTMIEVNAQITAIEAHLAAIAEWRSKSP